MNTIAVNSNLLKHRGTYIWTANKINSTIQGAKNLFLNKQCWDSWIATRERMKLDPYLTLYTKIGSKWSIDLHGRAKTIKHVEKIIKIKFHDFAFGNDFMYITVRGRNRVLGD